MIRGFEIRIGGSRFVADNFISLGSVFTTRKTLEGSFIEYAHFEPDGVRKDIVLTALDFIWHNERELSLICSDPDIGYRKLRIFDTTVPEKPYFKLTPRQMRLLVELGIEVAFQCK